MRSTFLAAILIMITLSKSHAADEEQIFLECSDDGRAIVAVEIDATLTGKNEGFVKRVLINNREVEFGLRAFGSRQINDRFIEFSVGLTGGGIEYWTISRTSGRSTRRIEGMSAAQPGTVIGSCKKADKEKKF